MKKRSFVREILFYVLIFAVIIIMLSTILKKDQEAAAIESYSELGGYIENDEVKELYVANDNTVTVTLKDGKVMTYKIAYLSIFIDQYGEELKRIEKVEYEPIAETPWWVSFLPTLFIIIVLVVIYFVAFKKMSGG